MTTVSPTDHSPSEGMCRRWRPAAVQDEERAHRQLVAELTARFPDRSAAEVEHAVALAWESLADSRLRDFVPVLAGKAATARLRRTRPTPTPPGPRSRRSASP